MKQTETAHATPVNPTWQSHVCVGVAVVVSPTQRPWPQFTPVHGSAEVMQSLPLKPAAQRHVYPPVLPWEQMPPWPQGADEQTLVSHDGPVKPSAHEHTYSPPPACVGKARHVPPWRHGVDSQTSTTVSQCAPPKPAAQLHVYVAVWPLGWVVQSPLAHGFEVHGSHPWTTLLSDCRSAHAATDCVHGV